MREKPNTSRRTHKAPKQEYIRINKLIASRSVYSRREADELIKNGAVCVDSKVVTDLSTTLPLDANISINGKELALQNSQYTVIVYNKPRGELVTKSDPRGRRTVYDTLGDKFAGFVPVGRLDFASEGMLLLTDSSSVAQKLMKSDLGRVYNITIDKPLSDAMKDAMMKGIELEDATAGAHTLTKQKSMTIAPFLGYKIKKDSTAFTKLSVMLSEGQNREIRRFFGAFGANVLDLKRVGFGWIDLCALPTGEWRYLSSKEYLGLKNFLKGDNVQKTHR